jgi:hypothetical protein
LGGAAFVVRRSAGRRPVTRPSRRRDMAGGGPYGRRPREARAAPPRSASRQDRREHDAEAAAHEPGARRA